MNNKTLFSIAMTLMLITACSTQTVPSSPEPTTSIESAPTQTSAAIPTETPNPLGEAKVYRDENAGFALDYPAAWFIEDDAARDAAGSAVYTASLFSWDRNSYTPTPKDPNTLPEGVTKIDITVFNQGSNSLEEAVHQYRNQSSGTSVNFFKQEDWTLNNGEKATYVESEGAFGVVATLIWLVKGKVIYVSGYGNFTLFKAIALTLRAE
jgi:hypothetical protein